MARGEVARPPSIVGSLRFWMLLGATAAAVGTGASWLSRRVKPGLVDWRVARSVALRISARPSAWQVTGRDAAEYGDMVEKSWRAVGAYLERPIGDRPPQVEVLDREAWIDVNVENFRKLIAPMEAAYGRLDVRHGVWGPLASGLTKVALSLQIGAMLGLLSRRVLGQYDIPLLEPGEGKIYLVDVNITALADTLRLRTHDLSQWVALHETTHAVEFETTPWLQAHMAGLLREYLGEAGEMILNPRRIGERMAASRPGARGLSKGGLLTMMLTDKQAAIVARIQALMSVMEGYSNHAMHHAGSDLVANYRFLAGRMRQRERARGVAFRVMSRLLGLDLKLEQYVIGERFVDHVVRERGVDFVNRVWQSPDLLPTLDEVRDPPRWVRRIESGGA